MSFSFFVCFSLRDRRSEVLLTLTYPLWGMREYFLTAMPRRAAPVSSHTVSSYAMGKKTGSLTDKDPLLKEVYFTLCCTSDVGVVLSIENPVKRCRNINETTISKYIFLRPISQRMIQLYDYSYTVIGNADYFRLSYY